MLQAELIHREILWRPCGVFRGWRRRKLSDFGLQIVSTAPEDTVDGLRHTGMLFLLLRGPMGPVRLLIHVGMNPRSLR